jgi:4-amino-4-deoxy-L-arabinose transferase-like glycosyltransferase
MDGPVIFSFIVLALILFKFIAGVADKKRLCIACFNQARPTTKTKGSLLIEVFLWLCFIIPGVIYSLWRSTSRYKVCPCCGAAGMIPLDSPQAKRILSQSAVR